MSEEKDAHLTFLEEAASYFENRSTGGEDRAHWANVYNAENCRKIASEITRLRGELEQAKSMVAEANNSLYGSHGYFCSINGGPFDKYHLASAIENLKSETKESERLRGEVERLRGALARADATIMAVASVRPGEKVHASAAGRIATARRYLEEQREARQSTNLQGE